MYWELEKRGWTGLFVTKEKECAIDLLKAYQLPYKVLGVNKKGMVRKILSLPMFSLRMIKIAREFRPDIFVSRVSPLSGYASRVVRKPHVTFTDTENVRLLDSISQPFADVILTSDVYIREHGRKQLRYPGYHELAYLHPNRFVPDTSVLSQLGIDHQTPYVVVRFVAWEAHHDVGHKGISNDNKIRLIEELSRQIRVILTSEYSLPSNLKKYQFSVEPEQMHDLLAFATLFIGESGTMATECAVLGVPNIQVRHTLESDKVPGVHFDLVSRGLKFLYLATDVEGILTKAREIIQDNSVHNKMREARAKMLSEMIDVTGFMCWFIEDYPSSIHRMRNDRSLFEKLEQGYLR
jgi:uncharacterized protein